MKKAILSCFVVFAFQFYYTQIMIKVGVGSVLEPEIDFISPEDITLSKREEV